MVKMGIVVAEDSNSKGSRMVRTGGLWGQDWSSEGPRMVRTGILTERRGQDWSS